MNLADPGVRVYYLFLGYSEKELGEEYQRQNEIEVTGW